MLHFQSMHMLVYDAGNIGSIYAGLLARAGHDVVILARGARLAQIRERGIGLEDAGIYNRVTVRLLAVDRLAPDDAYMHN